MVARRESWQLGSAPDSQDPQLQTGTASGWRELVLYRTFITWRTQIPLHRYVSAGYAKFGVPAGRRWEAGSVRVLTFCAVPLYCVQ
jgi:hypothetical protein